MKSEKRSTKAMNEFKLNCETSGIRLDKFISDADIDLSRSAAVNLIENGAVLVNDSVVSKSTSFRKVILLL